MAKRKSKKRAKGYLLPKYQTGERVLKPWEYIDKQGKLNTDVSKLPVDPEADKKYKEQLDFMRNWIPKRGTQMQNALHSYIKREDEKHPVDAFLHKYINIPLFGAPYSYGLSKEWGTTNKELEENILETAVNNVNTINFTDGSKINPKSYVPFAYGTYSPRSHSINFSSYPTDATKIHEIGHGTRLGSYRVFKDLIRDTIKEDKLYKDKRDSYYHSPEEIYSRIWEIRKGLNLNPTETITKELLNRKLEEKKSNYRINDYLDLFEYLEPETIIELLNSLVYEDTSLDIDKAQNGYKFPSEYLAKQAFVESTWDPKSLNQSSQAAGLTQFRPITIEDIRQRGFIDDSFDIYNPEDAIKAQIAYMNWLGQRPYIDKPNQTEDVRSAKTLLAYNRGPERAKKVLTDLKNRGIDIYSNLDWVDEIPDADEEGRNYIKMILQGQNTEGRPKVQENYQKALVDPKYQYIRDIYAEQTKPRSYTRPYKEGQSLYLNLKNKFQNGGEIDKYQDKGEVSQWRKNLATLNTGAGFDTPLLEIIKTILVPNEESGIPHPESNGFRKYLGVDQVGETMRFEPSPYKKDAFELKGYYEDFPEDLSMYSDEEIEAMGNFNMIESPIKPYSDYVFGRHSTKKVPTEDGGFYIEYTDRWDLDPEQFVKTPKNKEDRYPEYEDNLKNKILDYLGDKAEKLIFNPFDVYGRIYYNKEGKKIGDRPSTFQNGGEVLSEQSVQQELPYQEVISYPIERTPFQDPRVPRSADRSYYKNLYNTDVPKTLAKQYELWANTYKSPIGLKIDSYKDIYDTQAFFKSGRWRKGFKNIEEFRKPSHPMLGTINPETNTFIPDPKNINSNEDIASYILKENIPVKFREVERIPINPDGFAPGSATENADKVIIPSNSITTKDMQEPILANGEVLMPGEEVQFDTPYVVEEKLTKAQDGLTVDNTKTSMPIDPRFLELVTQEAVAKEEFQKLPKEVQEKIMLQQQINDPEFRSKNQGELYKGLTDKEKISNFMSDLGTEFAYGPRTLFTLEGPTFEEKQRNRSIRKDDLGEVWENRGLSILDGLTWFMGGELFGAGLGKAGELSVPYIIGAEESAKKLISPIKGAIDNYRTGISWAKDYPNWRKAYQSFKTDMHPQISLVRQSKKDLRNKLIDEGKIKPTFKEEVERKVASTVDDLRTKGIIPLGEKEAAKIAKAQNKAFNEGVDITNAWFYPQELGSQINPLTGNLDLISPGKLRPHIKTKIMGILDDAVKPTKELQELGFTTSGPVTNAFKIAMSGKNPYTLNQTAFNFNRSSSPLFKTHNLPMQEGLKNIYDQYVSGALSSEEAKYLLSNFGTLGGVNFHGGPSVTYLNRGNYLKDPLKVFNVAAHETGHTTQKLGIESLEDALGIALKEGEKPTSFYWRDAIAHAPEGYSYSIPNPISKIGKIAEEIMVPPNMSAENYVWHASPLEVHSELMAHRADIINKLKKRGNLSTEDAVQWLQEHEWDKNLTLPLGKNKKTGKWEYLPTSKQEMITPQNEYISKLRRRGFFKKGVTDKQILEFLKLFPAFTGAAAIGSAGIKD